MTKKKKIMLLVVFVLLIGAVVLGISYAYWRLTYQATNINKIVSSCFSMELTNEKNNITLESAYPISDEKGKALTPYSFTITNTCDLFASYTINLEMLEGTTLDSKYIKTMINSEEIINLNSLETTDPSIEGATGSRILFKGSLGAGESTDYTLRIWMDSDTPFSEDSMNKIFQSKITVTAEVSTYSPVENGFTNLAEALLVNEYQTTNLDVAKNKVTSKQEVDFSKTAPIIDWQSIEEQSYSELSVAKLDKDIATSVGATEDMAKIVFGTSYTFNSETGKYTLNDGAFYDPITLDFSSNEYYMCGECIDTFIYAGDGTCSSSALYKVSKLISSQDIPYDYNGETITITNYVFEQKKVYGFELESDNSDKGLYKTTDETGDTFYYRGNVTNNIVKFADHYWRVLRINGDGSIRLLYADSYAGKNTDFGVSLGFFNANIDNPTYLGYMYSNTLNVSHEMNASNDNDSTIKTTLDNWYKTNILDAGYSSYIADSGFCNDRSVYYSNGVTSAHEIYYNGYVRMNSLSPSYICPNAASDLFTLSGNAKGNGALTYPIAIPTLDDVIYAGISPGYINRKTFVNGDTYWLMTPYVNSSAYGMPFISVLSGDGLTAYSGLSSNFLARPVINLKADTEIVSGIGTKNAPFIIK